MKKFAFVSVVAFMFTSSVQARDGNYFVHMIRCEGQLGDKDIPVERRVTSMGKVVLRSGSSGAVRVGFRLGMGDELADVTHSCEAEVLQIGELVDMHVTLEKKITAITASAAIATGS